MKYYSLVLSFILTISLSAQFFSKGGGSSPKTTSALLIDAEQAPLGESFYVYLNLTFPSGWYGYYFNNTISYTLRPELSLEPIDGVTYGELEYQVPTIKEAYDIPSYVLMGSTLYRLPVTVDPAKFSVGEELMLKGAASWQICKESCLPPEEAEVSLSVTLAESVSAEGNFTEGFTNVESVPVTAQLEAEAIVLSVGQLLESPKFYDLDGQVAFSAEQVVTTSEDRTQLRLALDAGNSFRSDIIAPQERLRGYVVANGGDFRLWIDTAFSSEIAAPVAPTTEPVESVVEESDQQVDDLKLPSEEEMAQLYNGEEKLAYQTLGESKPVTFWLALGGAFFGGILLNLMPCVFPVLSLKVLSFVEKAGEATWKVRLHGALFTLGVVLSMWVLAVALFLLRHYSGDNVNWGQQMSYPEVVAGIVIILFLFGLNMAGVFELGTKLTSLGGQSTQKSGYAATIFSGVLTTLIATPCSGPFLGSAMAYTLSQPVLPSLVLFTVFALGISFPYLLLSFFPALTSKLPRPGAWMETLKKVLAFGMFAAAAFFMQTFAAQAGGAGLSILVMALVIIGLAAYFYGHWTLPHLKKGVRYGLGFGLSSLVLAAGLLLSWKAATEYKAPVSIEAQSNGSVKWHSWKPGIVEHLRAEGYYVWVDYTAVWCATCQVNKKLIFGNKDFVNSLPQGKMVFVKADLTDREAELTKVISKDLSRVDRVAIPVNLLYSPVEKVHPVLLEDAISISDVETAFDLIEFSQE